MLSPEYLWSISDSVVNAYDELNSWAIRDMAERIMAAELYDYDGLPGTARYRAWMLNQSGVHYEEMAKKLAEITKKSEQEIKKLFIDAGLTAIENDYAPTGEKPYDIIKDKRATQILQSGYEHTNGELKNYTRTTLDRHNKLMIDVLDKAHFDVTSGAKSYTQAINEAIDTLANGGICEVVYPSGHIDKIETAVRRAVMTGLNQATAKLSLHNCEKLGTDYVIVSSHIGARYNETDKIANHMGWQGGVYKIHGTGSYIAEGTGFLNSAKKLFKRLGLKFKGDYIPNLEEETGFPSNPLGLCGYNCRHSFYPFIPGVDNPDKYKDIVTDEKESKRAYDISQKQRAFERDIRNTKHGLLAYQTAIDNCKDEGVKFEFQLKYDKLAAKLQRKNKEYREFCERNNVPTEAERIKVGNWKREQSYQATRGAKRYNDSVVKMEDKKTTNSNDWSKTTTKEYTKSELEEIRKYGEAKDVIVSDISKFDGNKELIKLHIDTIEKMREDFPCIRDKRIAIRVSNKMPDDDFAESINNTTITYNTKALRNKEITIKNINSGSMFASVEVKDITIHEIGHIIAAKIGNKGIEFARKAYYNVYNKMLSEADIMEYLAENISVYTRTYYGNYEMDLARGRVKESKFKEIIPEVVVKNSNNPTKFTEEFVRLLKE